MWIQRCNRKTVRRKPSFRCWFEILQELSSASKPRESCRTCLRISWNRIAPCDHLVGVQVNDRVTKTSEALTDEHPSAVDLEFHSIGERGRIGYPQSDFRSQPIPWVACNLPGTSGCTRMRLIPPRAQIEERGPVATPAEVLDNLAVAIWRDGPLGIPPALRSYETSALANTTGCVPAFHAASLKMYPHRLTHDRWRIRCCAQQQYRRKRTVSSPK